MNIRLKIILDIMKIFFSNHNLCIFMYINNIIYASNTNAYFHNLFIILSIGPFQLISIKAQKDTENIMTCKIPKCKI